MSVSPRRVSSAAVCITPIRVSQTSNPMYVSQRASPRAESFTIPSDIMGADRSWSAFAEETKQQGPYSTTGPMNYVRCDNCEQQFIPSTNHCDDFCSGECRWSWNGRVESNVRKFSSSSSCSFYDYGGQSLLDDDDDDESAELRFAR